MTKELYQAFVKYAPATFHTVAPLVMAESESGSLPLITLEDIQDGCARTKSDLNVNTIRGGLPALLIYEIKLGAGVLVAVWHRDETDNEMLAGARVSIRTRDELIAATITAIQSTERGEPSLGLDVNVREMIFRNENAYQAQALTIPFRYDTNCLTNGNASVETPDFIPGIY